ncbi:MAG: condensation domain-containing protein, partial [Aquabacterium sp.]|uniref:condensation domain-containing protein n=1 Tax=Aquabacterium sp. TaxID=1872578 RepID=UPI0027268BE5
MTSGSTGKPKSVAVAHGALSRHIQAAGDLYAYSPADRALHFAALTFDAAIEQWLVPLCYGAGVVLGFSDWTGDDTAAAVLDHQATVLYPPTSHLLHLADTLTARRQTLNLRIACVGGEAVSADALGKIRQVLKPQRIINGYGPTETVITPLAWQADASAWRGYAPIGQAVGERTLYILDKDLNPLPLGAVGELYIGGPCLARGYHNRPDLSAERFIPDPFAGDGSRLYRTGDLVRYRADGSVDYLGRADHQIKLRGYRIEPGEIEAALRQLPGVGDAYVMLRDDHGRPYLAAYLAQAAEQPDPGSDGDLAGLETVPAAPDATPAALTPVALQAALVQRLPDYMIPAKFVLLAQLPRTAHGKVDRRRLPAPDFSEAAVPKAPSNATESLLVQLWQDLLGQPNIGIRDNFFELGGDSIISIQLVSRARALGLLFTPKQLFQHQTIESLAQVAVSADDQHVGEPQTPVTGSATLLPIQHAFFGQTLPNPQHWNQSLLLKTRQALNLEHLQQALEYLISHHDSLRLRFRQQGGQWQQTYAEADTAQAAIGAAASANPTKVAPQANLTTAWEQHTASAAADITAIAQQAQRRLDLEHGPMFKAEHILVADGTERLLLIGHHLIVDAVSWRILLEDLQSLYSQLQQGQTPSLPAKTASYQAWGKALQAYAQSPALQQQHAYWPAQTQHHGDWPCDHPQGRAQTRDRDSQTLTLSTERTRQLLHAANLPYRTRIQELLLAALAQTLADWTGQRDIAVELEGHGREADAVAQANGTNGTNGINAALDLSRSIGWFTSLYPVRLSVGQDWHATVKAVKEQLRQVPDHGIGHGVLKHLTANPEQKGQNPTPHKPSVTFNYLGQFDSSFDANALWQPADEDSGDERDPAAPLGNELEINGEIYQGQLRLDWGYSRQRYHAQTIQTLLHSYQSHLHSLLDHCLDAEPNLTPSDLPLAKLSQAQLDALPVAHHQIEDLYPLSPMQQGILFHAL